LRVEQDGHGGTGVQEYGWLFNEDGSITHMMQRMFLADDLSTEEWENRLLTLTASQAGVPRTLLLTVERGLRADGILIVKYSGQPNAAELKEKVLEIEPSFASAGFCSLLPRFIDLKASELYAFSTYNSERRGLTMRTIRVAGPTRVLSAGKMVPVIKLEDSEGLIPPLNEIYMDDAGEIVQVKAGPLEMSVVTREYVEREYGARRKEAEQLFRRYPVREPILGRRDVPAR
jgi:hypothetical protein